MDLTVGRVTGPFGTRKYNVANVVCDVEHFLGVIHFESDFMMLRDSADVCIVALTSVVAALTTSGDREAGRLGVRILAICDLLDRAAHISDGPEDKDRRVSIMRVCRAALSQLLSQLDQLVVQERFDAGITTSVYEDEVKYEVKDGIKYRVCPDCGEKMERYRGDEFWLCGCGVCIPMTVDELKTPHG